LDSFDRDVSTFDPAVVSLYIELLLAPPLAVCSYQHFSVTPTTDYTSSFNYIYYDSESSDIPNIYNKVYSTPITYSINMVSLSYLINEPHPSAPRGRSTAYLGSGRGGAGNYARYKVEELTVGNQATGPASRGAISPPPPTQKYTAGRGGMGNTFTRQESQRAIFSFDEELARDQKLMDARAKAPVYHTGRGGSGNFVDEMKPATSRQNSAASISSNGSAMSDKARRIGGAFRSLSRTFSRDSTRE
jgi:hypothetical protein